MTARKASEGRAHSGLLSERRAGDPTALSTLEYVEIGISTAL